MMTPENDRQDSWGGLPPWEQPGAFRRDCKPHRGFVLVCAAVGCLALPVLIYLRCPKPPRPVGRLLDLVPSPAAQLLDLVAVLVALLLTFLTGVSARRDLALMHQGQMDPRGEAATRAACALCRLAAAPLVLLLLCGLAAFFMGERLLPELGL